MSNNLRLYACYSYVALVLLGHRFFGQTNGQMYREVGGKKLAYYAVTVDPSGHGNFTTIQSAIDAVPSDNKHWISIRIKPGTYREKVTIPREKPYIILKGQNKRNTYIVWGDHDSLAQSYTFASFANNTIVKSISFVNSYSYPLNSNPRTPAVAALIDGDESTFYKCGFHGVQDTLWDAGGRHYYKLCTIHGAVDFICGAGQSIFEKSTISVLGGALDPGSVGYITAQARAGPNDAGGFVFKDCRVIGNGFTYLGRPWEPYSRVIFYNSFLSDVVVPQGWSPWDKEGNVGHITYAEQGCYGPGADTSQRVGWEKKLSPSTVHQLAGLDFIDSDGWLSDQPL